jgi:hypothetical protein
MKMMTDMMIKPSSDVDRDFVAMVMPHRQGAVDMAKDELRHGHNEQLRQLAWEIATNQQWEISGMRNSIGDKGSSATQLTEQLPRGLSSPQASPDSMVADGAVTPQ